MSEIRPGTPGKRRTRARRAALLLAAAAVGLVAYGGVKANRIERDAHRFAETGKAVLALLSEHAAGLQAGELDRILPLYTADFTSPDDGAWRQDLREQRDGVAVYDWRVEAPETYDFDELAGHLKAFMAASGELDQAKLKLAALEDLSQDDVAVVRTVLWLRGSLQDGTAFESHATLRLWLRREDAGWRIHRRALLDGETVTGRRQGFVDVAATAGLGFESRINPLFSSPEWQLERFGILKYGTAGVSAVDYDGDGWDDLFFGDGEHPRLFRNRGDGTFEESTEAAGLPTRSPSANAGLFADLDNDGDKDFVLTGYTQPSRLFENRGDGTFAERTEVDLGRGFVTVISAGDYDADGLLDLYLGRYLDARTELPATLFYTRNGVGNSLLRNRGKPHVRGRHRDRGGARRRPDPRRGLGRRGHRRRPRPLRGQRLRAQRTVRQPG